MVLKYVHTFICWDPSGDLGGIAGILQELGEFPEGRDEEYPGAIQGGLVQVGAWAWVDSKVSRK